MTMLADLPEKCMVSQTEHSHSTTNQRNTEKTLWPTCHKTSRSAIVIILTVYYFFFVVEII